MLKFHHVAKSESSNTGPGACPNHHDLTAVQWSLTNAHTEKNKLDTRDINIKLCSGQK